MDNNNHLIRFGVLGAGRVVPYGLVQPARGTPGVEVRGIASRTLDKAQSFAGMYDIKRVFSSYDALLDSKDIDAVYIALPTGLHDEWVRRALSAGKHILCEKPLAANAGSAKELVSFATNHCRVLIEGMHIRYLAKLRRQRELLESGIVGRLLCIESCFRDPRTPMAEHDFRLRFELGGGAGLDLGCYAVSCLRYVSGEEPEIKSVRYKCASPQIDRWMRATFRLPSGAEAVAECGFRGFYRARFGVFVTGERGWIKWDNDGLVYKRDGNLIREPIPAKSTYRLQMEAFARSVRGESSDALSAEDSVLTAEVVDAMYSNTKLGIRGSIC